MGSKRTPRAQCLSTSQGNHTAASVCLVSDISGSGGPRFDHQGMVLPHSILGSLQDYKSYLKTIGKADVERASVSMRAWLAWVVFI